MNDIKIIVVCVWFQNHRVTDIIIIVKCSGHYRMCRVHMSLFMGLRVVGPSYICMIRGSEHNQHSE